jgi:hypothetical protein
MKNDVVSSKAKAKTKNAADVVPQKKQDKLGPVELDLDELKKVSGGSPKQKWC